MIQQRFAIVDLETTGGSFGYDRVIEVGAIIMENGKIVEEYQTLVNPERHVPPSILLLTGIKQEDLWKAPTFDQICSKLTEVLGDATFVAHNARFDKGFLKAEFERCEIKFNPKTVCTVQLSRKVFPGQRHHNLDTLMNRIGAYAQNRHRAYDDAHVLYEFFRYIEKNFTRDEQESFFKQVLKENAIPPNLSKEKLKDLPELPGVYIFYDENNFPLYIGKSINIRERVMSHFHDSVNSAKELKIFQKVNTIETIVTCGELGALFLESELVKKLSPLHNRKLRKTKILTALMKTKHEDYHNVEITYLEEVSPEKIQDTLGIFRSKRQAEKYLEEISREFALCKKLMGIEKAKNHCFSYQLKYCKGSCMGEEDAFTYNQRFNEAFKKTALRPWPFKGVLSFEEKSEENGKSEVFFVQNWCLIAKGESSDFGFDLKKIPERRFDLDQYKILNTHLLRRKNKNGIKLLSSEDFTHMLSQNEYATNE